MSKISLQPNASGTGTFTLEAPNSNTNRTLSLPDEAGSVLTDVSDLEPQVKTATNATGSAPVYACRAWVNFNLRTSVGIQGSGNVSSITDVATGIFEVNFSTAMEDANYAVAFSPGEAQVSFTGNIALGANTNSGLKTSGKIFIDTSNNTGVRVDLNGHSVAIFR